MPRDRITVLAPHDVIGMVASIGIASVNRVLACLSESRVEHFSADHLANRLGITSRSARRILGELERMGVIERCGLGQAVGKGRPRQLFRKSVGSP